jgi:outer membrane lipoprotein-sorting protein
MDQAASGFRGMTAKITKTSYTAIIKESTEESGIITMRSPKPRQVAALIEFDKPAPKSIAFRDKKAQIFLPKINTVQEYDLGKYNDLLTQGLLIGFATPAKDLRKNYAIKITGESEVVSGQKTTKLQLLPIQETIKQHLSRIELWISETDGLPVQQKLYQPSGDYTQIQYQDMKLQSVLTDRQVRLNLPADVKREFPQK